MMKIQTPFRSLLALSLSLLFSVQTLWADSDSLTAKILLDAGKIQPLELILKQVRPKYPGTILEIELEQEDGEIIYEIEVLREDGVVIEIIIDAKTGLLLRTELND